MLPSWFAGTGRLVAVLTCYALIAGGIADTLRDPVFALAFCGHSNSGPTAPGVPVPHQGLCSPAACAPIAGGSILPSHHAVEGAVVASSASWRPFTIALNDDRIGPAPRSRGPPDPEYRHSSRRV